MIHVRVELKKKKNCGDSSFLKGVFLSFVICNPVILCYDSDTQNGVFPFMLLFCWVVLTGVKGDTGKES